MLSLYIIVPLAGLILLNLPFGMAVRKWAWVFAAYMGLLQIAVATAALGSGWAVPGSLDKMFAFNLHATLLGNIFLLAIGLVLFVTLLVERDMITDERRRASFVNVLLVSLIGMNGIVLVTDIFSLYVFVEVTAVASFIMIAFAHGKAGLEGAFKYLVLSAVASVLLLSGIGLIVLTAGAMSFSGVQAALASSSNHPVVLAAVLLFVGGLFIKGGLVPFHGWLPDAYSSAPAPASILLAGIVTKASGIYALIRLVTEVFPQSQALNQVLLLFGAVSIFVGAAAALGQKDIKRMLAYSSISQVGYIILGLGCATPLGLIGAIFHLFNHSVFKSLLFVNSAALEQRLGTTDMDQMTGVGPRMPWTGVTSLIASLSTAGVPPLAGFWSKLIIIVALWKGGQANPSGVVAVPGGEGYAIFALLLSVLTLAYFLSMQRRVFYGQLKEEFASVREASFGIVCAAVLLAVLTVGIGIAFPLMYNGKLF